MYIDLATDKVVQLYVDLPIPSESGRSQLETPPFALPRKNADDTTLVFDWRPEKDPYYRPGEWVKYVDTLLQVIQARWQATERLNGERVYDGDLFR